MPSSDRDSERRQRLLELIERALDRPLEERREFLREESTEDQRQDVESLLDPRTELVPYGESATKTLTADDTPGSVESEESEELRQWGDLEIVRKLGR